jgi:hypothetical protein
MRRAKPAQRTRRRAKLTQRTSGEDLTLKKKKSKAHTEREMIIKLTGAHVRGEVPRVVISPLLLCNRAAEYEAMAK